MTLLPACNKSPTILHNSPETREKQVPVRWSRWYVVDKEREDGGGRGGRGDPFYACFIVIIYILDTFPSLPSP